jgi:hypothetical protein
VTSSIISHGVQRLWVNDARGVLFRAADGVHALREGAAGRQVRENDVGGERDQPVGEPVAVPCGPRDVKLEGEALHDPASVTRPRGGHHFVAPPTNPTLSAEGGANWWGW